MEKIKEQITKYGNLAKSITAVFALVAMIVSGWAWADQKIDTRIKQTLSEEFRELKANDTAVQMDVERISNSINAFRTQQQLEQRDLAEDVDKLGERLDRITEILIQLNNTQTRFARPVTD